MGLLCGKLGAGDLGPNGEGLRTRGSVPDGSDVIAAEVCTGLRL